MTLRSRFALLITAALFIVVQAPTTHANEEAVEPDAHDTEAEQHAFHRHHFGLILGGASTSDGSRNDQHGFCVGGDYEWRFSKWVGIGPIAEVAIGDLRDVVFVGSAWLHPWRGLVLTVGPGVELSSHGAQYLTRVGVAYQIPISSRFTIAPDFSIDIVDRKAIYVYGVAIGVGF